MLKHKVASLHGSFAAKITEKLEDEVQIKRFTRWICADSGIETRLVRLQLRVYVCTVTYTAITKTEQGSPYSDSVRKL